MIEPKPVTGYGPDAAWLTRMRDYQRSYRLLSGRGYRVSQTTDGIIILLDDRKGGNSAPVQIKTFLIKNVQHDYVVCNAIGKTAPTDPETNVAKNPEIRQSIKSELIFGADSGGTTYSYTYGSGPDSLNVFRTSMVGATDPAPEIQLVIPTWIPGKPLIAIKYSDPTVFANDGITGFSTSWIMMHPRYWAKQ